ncbi:MAG TPA: hypothetical protein VM142_01730 [Acidimicrobiales bacterium]|nr:hypothetical protein [Acidimicrobiales bacterium]
MHLERTPFYEKELSLRFARSYGPGRQLPVAETDLRALAPPLPGIRVS